MTITINDNELAAKIARRIFSVIRPDKVWQHYPKGKQMAAQTQCLTLARELIDIVRKYGEAPET